MLSPTGGARRAARQKTVHRGQPSPGTWPTRARYQALCPTRPTPWSAVVRVGDVLPEPEDSADDQPLDAMFGRPTHVAVYADGRPPAERPHGPGRTRGARPVRSIRLRATK